jgi:thioredoxin 1
MADITLTDQNFSEEVLKSDIPVLVDFWAAWCMPCRMVGPTIEELAAEYEGKVKVGKMNVDENGQTPGNFGVMSLPTVFIFKNGQPVKTIVGAQSKENYKKEIDTVLNS